MSEKLCSASAFSSSGENKLKGMNWKKAITTEASTTEARTFADCFTALLEVNEIEFHAPGLYVAEAVKFSVQVSSGGILLLAATRLAGSSLALMAC